MLYPKFIGKYFYFPSMFYQEVFVVKSDSCVYSSLDNTITTSDEVYRELNASTAILYEDERFFPECNYNAIFTEAYLEHFCDLDQVPKDGTEYVDISIVDEFWDRYSIEECL